MRICRPEILRPGLRRHSRPEATRRRNQRGRRNCCEASCLRMPRSSDLCTWASPGRAAPVNHQRCSPVQAFGNPSAAARPRLSIQTSSLPPEAVSLREGWHVLPASIVTAIENRTGTIERVVPAKHGFSSNVAATLQTPSGTVFIKAMRDVGNTGVETQSREAKVSRHVRGIGPGLRWRIRDGGWDVLCFEHVDGRIADYREPSGDLTAVAEAMSLLSDLPDPGDDLWSPGVRWAAHLPHPSDAEILSGTSLVHTDWHHTNVLITSDGSVRLTDWSHALRGADWIDPACWVVWLVLSGHGPVTAERWASKVPSFATADPGALDLFSGVLENYWQSIAENHPNTMTTELKCAAAAWAAHRSSARRRA